MPEPRQKTKAPRIENIKKSKKVLGEQICSCILFVHALLGCDTISPVHGSGKPAPLKKILTSDHYSLALAQTMSRGPGTPKEEIIAADEQAPVCLYNEKHGEVLMLYATHASRKRWQGVQNMLRQKTCHQLLQQWNTCTTLFEPFSQESSGREIRATCNWLNGAGHMVAICKVIY